MNLNERIKELLLEKKWTYYKLSKLSGVPISTVEQLVHGTRKTTSHEHIQKIATAFGITPDGLLGEVTPKIPELDGIWVEVVAHAKDKKVDPKKVMEIINLLAKGENK